MVDDMTNAIKAIAPYSNEEVAKALARLSKSKVFFQGVKYFYPHWTKEILLEKLQKCRSCADFKIVFMEEVIRNILQNSSTGFEVVGLDRFSKTDNYLCISNHRDIFLDAGLLQYALYHHDLPFTEISLGDNLLMDELIETVAKMNNMFTVHRSGTKMERLRNAQRLSAYLRHTITEKKTSAWIAQGNGRTKNGSDQTFPGLVNMLLMSGGSDYKRSVEELNIVVSAISYEYEPCAFEKAVEMSVKAKTGKYEKSKYEDLQSMIKGIESPKGNICLTLERLDLASIDFSGNRKETTHAIAKAIDHTIYNNYRLWPTNYIAYDRCHQTSRFAGRYSSEATTAFDEYLSNKEYPKEVVQRVLQMYAAPVANWLEVRQDD